MEDPALLVSAGVTPKGSNLLGAVAEGFAILNSELVPVNLIVFRTGDVCSSTCVSDASLLSERGSIIRSMSRFLNSLQTQPVQFTS